MVTLNQNLISESGFYHFYGNNSDDEGQYFADYLEGLDLLGESKLLVLSMRQHYYFDYNDLKDLRVLVLLRKLDFVEHFEDFLMLMSRILPSGACFVGCFTDKNLPFVNYQSYYHSSSVYYKFLNYCESKTHLQLHKRNFLADIEMHGLNVFDLTKIKDQIYFASRNKLIPS